MNIPCITVTVWVKAEIESDTLEEQLAVSVCTYAIQNASDYAQHVIKQELPKFKSPGYISCVSPG